MRFFTCFVVVLVVLVVLIVLADDDGVDVVVLSCCSSSCFWQGHVVKSWKKRYFVLDAENLSYYKHDKLKGLIPVSKITNLLCQMDNRGRSIGFEIQTR